MHFILPLLFVALFSFSAFAQDFEPPSHGAAREIWNILYAEPEETNKTEVPQKTDNESLPPFLNIKELNKLYETREYRPVWDIESSLAQQNLRAFLEYMRTFTYYHGLEPQDKTIDLFIKLSQTPDQTNKPLFDIALTDWLISIAHELNGDAIDYAHLFTGWEFHTNDRDLIADLAQALYHGQIYDYLPTLTPATTEYLFLARALRLYRAIAQQQPWKPIDDGPILRLGDKSPRVLQVRNRLVNELYMLPICQNEEDTLDSDLHRIILTYQSRNGLETDGNIGSETIYDMNKPVDLRIDQIRTNMAFARAMPRQFPDRLAYVNIADASIKIFRHGEVIHHAQTVVGMPMRKTPFINSAIDSVILNPMWKIPISIARYDILPKLRKNPRLLEEKGYAIRWREDDPYGHGIDFSNMSPRQFNYQLRQRPGPKNALGEVKFDFKNKFSVYLHGTPHKEDFGKSGRHKSSGCIRLKDPPKIASIILEENEVPWSYNDVKKEIGKLPVFPIKVDNPLPIFVVYRTSFFPAEDSALHFRRDIYRYDQRLLTALKDKVKDYNQLFSK